MFFRRLSEHLKKQNWFAVALEFIIVVVGVFVGLQAQEWRESAADRERLDRIVAAIRADMEDGRRVETEFWTAIEAGLADFEKAYRRGERPTPFVFRIKGSDTAPDLILGSLQEAGIGELVDPKLLFELNHFYAERMGIGVKITRYMASIENTVLPYLGGDPLFFYDESGSALRPEYRATMDRLREWAQYLADLKPWSECLEKRLNAASRPGQSCRRNWYSEFGEQSYGEGRE